MIETDGPVARITLNRPEVHNAFNEALIAELTEAVRTLSANPSIRVVVLKGAGKSFCAGADLAWMGKMAAFSHEENLADARKLQQLFQALDDCPKLTVALVHGAALGGGAGLVAVCDLAIAHEEARLGFTEAKLGILPAVISPYVVRRVGLAKAKQLFLSGRVYLGSTAKELGLVDHTVQTPEELDEILETQYLNDFLPLGPEAVAATKRLLREIEGKTPTEVAEVTVQAIAAARVSDEGQEGIRAFLEKRKPSWGQAQ